MKLPLGQFPPSSQIQTAFAIFESFLSVRKEKIFFPSPQVTNNQKQSQKQSILTMESERPSISVLQRLPLFQDLKSDSLQKISDMSKIVQFHKNERIVQEGLISQSAYLLLEGSVQILKNSEEGEEKKLIRLESGSVIGGNCLVRTRRERKKKGRAMQMLFP